MSDPFSSAEIETRDTFINRKVKAATKTVEMSVRGKQVIGESPLTFPRICVSCGAMDTGGTTYNKNVSIYQTFFSMIFFRYYGPFAKVKYFLCNDCLDYRAKKAKLTAFTLLGAILLMVVMSPLLFLLFWKCITFIMAGNFSREVYLGFKSYLYMFFVIGIIIQILAFVVSSISQASKINYQDVYIVDTEPFFVLEGMSNKFFYSYNQYIQDHKRYRPNDSDYDEDEINEIEEGSSRVDSFRSS